MATVRISSSGHISLKELSKRFDKSIPQVLDMLIKKYEEELFFKELNDSILKVQANKELWNEVQNEKRLLDGTLQDGLEDEEPYYTEEELKKIFE